MNGWRVSVWVAIVIGFVSLWGDVIAEQASLSDQLVGTWSLISVDYVRPDGSRFRTFGDDPRGIAFFDRNGHYIIAVMRSDRPKFAVNDRMKGTADEYKAAAQGVMTYFGTYSVNESDRTISIRVASSSFPNWNGADQQRVVKLAGDELTLINPVGSTGGGSAEVVWKRAK
jgi:Lipocalin-like domain